MTLFQNSIMQPLFTFNVVPKLPARLEPLREMVFNLWWTWEPSARRLYRHINPVLWDRTNHNPVRMLQQARQARLDKLAEDEAFLRDLDTVYANFRAYVDRKDTYGSFRRNGADRLFFRRVRLS